MKYVRFGLLLLIASVLTIQAQITEMDPESIASSLFIGQVYPSGNVYLKSFNSSKATGNWPRTVMIESLFKEPPQSRPTPIEAMLSTNTVRTDYIPAVEGMDDEHRACGTAVIRKKALRYESDDFFEGMFDYCDGNQGVARYQSSSLPHSVKVLASNLENPLTNVHRLAGRRPLTSAEKKAVAAQKLEVEKGAKCTSTPAFIDSAVYLLEAVAPDGFTVRLSSYKTPGCAGHLATIYVLDILRKKDVIRTFQLSQSHGAL